MQIFVSLEYTLFINYISVRLFRLEHRSDVSLSLIIDGPLECIRKLISEIRMKSFSKENWQLWYSRSGSGQFVRQASTASCVINEMIYGTSDQSTDLFAKFLGKNRSKITRSQENRAVDANDKLDFNLRKGKFVWKTSQDAKEQVINCVGAVLHEYLSHEIWELPIDEKSSKLPQGMQAENLSLHFLRDSIMLHQEIYHHHFHYNNSFFHVFDEL